MKRFNLFLFALLSVIFVSISVAETSSDQIKTPTFKEILSLKTPNSPLISPDGRYIVYTVRETDWEDNEYKNPKFN